jgi:hypothetical protein
MRTLLLVARFPVSTIRMSTPCEFTLPTAVDINTYLPRIANIMTQLAASNNKDVAIERLDTLIAELNLAINNNSGTTVFPITPGGSVKNRKKKICNC